MSRRHAVRAVATLVAGTALVLLPAQAAQAHPLGNFTVSQYDGIVVAPGELTVDHVEDLAEIPASQERRRIDTDGDDRLSPAELSAWARARCDAAAGGARLTVGGGDARPLKAAKATAEVRPGQAGLETLRVTCASTAPLPRQERMDLRYAPAAVSAGPGWREITARGDRMTLAESDVSGDSVSRRLTAYPDDLLSSPPGSRSAALSVRAGGPALTGDGGASGSEASPTGGVLPRGADRWAQALTGLVARHELTAGFAVLALGAALLLGAMHALAPGHGKTMMAAAAAAGGRSSRRDMLALAGSVTLTHTLGVFALGALITAGSAAAPSVVSWLGIASGTLVAVAGGLLLRRAWRRRHHAHGHSHGHTHGHGHGHAHAHGDGHAHDHAHDPPHSHSHDHPHDHGHGHTHSHLPPAPGLRGVILLGLAGGLVPSPSAVVVLVGAAALGQAWFGFLLVLAYGAGVALTLAVAGFAVVRLRETTKRRLVERPRGRLVSLAQRTAPLGTAAVVLALGCGLVLRGAATALA
ncbi:sulfite exporter TauE/SafE family protein [Streptomyces ficellus]|uniref:Nickel transporter n=1 Tax=Streptomyces ficellus TaxID=1977088 RepID=A0A6I6FDD3_9ACTN|nr:sulfite exporter TauE/SafE family protein [Streptomyces ficellus]QGV77145.1 nickel transporter [Streptomyces ficellus]